MSTLTNTEPELYTTPVPLTFGELEAIILALILAGRQDKVDEAELIKKLRGYETAAMEAGK